LVEDFDLGLDTTTLVIVGHNLDQTLTRATAVRQILEEHLGPDLDLSSPTRWLRPGDQVRERLAAIQNLPFAEAADLLAAELGRAGFAASAFAPGLNALRALGRGDDPAPISPSLWPPGIDELLRQEEDATYAALRLRLPEDRWPQGPPEALERALRQAAPGIKIASVPAIGAELGILARQDLRTLSLLALLGVGTVVLISFRASLRASLLAMTPVLLGSLWTLGLWGLMGRSIDLLSLAVVPIMLGIGIDDGLHALHGSGPRAAKLGESVRLAARAMTLTSLTTCVGFGSLTLSRVPGLANGGLLVALGVAACLLATLLVLPALAKCLPNPGTRRLHPAPRGE
jgi:predicted exporter